MSLLYFNFIMIYIDHKMLVLLNNYLNYIKDSIFECFFKEELNYTAIKDIRILIGLEKGNESN